MLDALQEDNQTSVRHLLEWAAIFLLAHRPKLSVSHLLPALQTVRYIRTCTLHVVHTPAVVVHWPQYSQWHVLSPYYMYMYVHVGNCVLYMYKHVVFSAACPGLFLPALSPALPLHHHCPPLPHFRAPGNCEILPALDLLATRCTLTFFFPDSVLLCHVASCISMGNLPPLCGACVCPARGRGDGGTGPADRGGDGLTGRAAGRGRGPRGSASFHQ